MPLFNSSSIKAFMGVMPVPVAMNMAVFSGDVLKINLPFGPINSSLSPIFREFSQLLPRPPGMTFRHVAKVLLSFLGAAEME